MEKYIRKVTRVGKRILSVVIPADIVKELSIRERQKLETRRAFLRRYVDKTVLFKNTASARSVAEAGYNAMLAGKLDVIAGVTTAQKLTMWLLPFLPKKLLLKQVRQMQEVE